MMLPVAALPPAATGDAMFLSSLGADQYSQSHAAAHKAAGISTDTISTVAN